MIKKYVIDFELSSQLTAGPKAREDANRILAREGYSLIKLNYSKMIPLRSVFSLFSLLWRVSILSEVVVQYPIGQICPTGLVLFFLRLKGAKIVILVHDLESLRRAGSISASEMRNLNRANLLILHSQAMLSAVRNAGLKQSVKTRILNVFDYLTDKERFSSSRAGNTVVFAGNLTKTHCVQLFAETGVLFHLYGAENPCVSNEKIRYMGCFSPNEIDIIDGDWGLVWDGDSIDSCRGRLGEYLRYNVPHKLSLYIVTGLPVIVWRQSAIADFVIDNDLGITVESLAELDGVLSEVTDEQYQMMAHRVMEMAEKVKSGKNLAFALKNEGN